jgi:integrase
MPLRVTRRHSTGALTISGTVAGRRIRRRAQSNEPKLAAEEAATLEARLLRTEWHGERRGARSFAEAVLSYLDALPRSPRTLATLRRLQIAVGTKTLAEIDQREAVRLRRVMLRPNAGPATYLREVVTPLRAVLNHAHGLGWCDPPRIAAPRQPQGRTRTLDPDEAERLIAASASHLRPLVIFLIGTGARLGEALALEWRDVDLVGGRAILWRTKNGRRRVCELHPRCIRALSALEDRDGRVFGRPDRQPYADRAFGGGQIKTAWRGAVRRAGLDPALRVHDLRHCWASWHYALHKDLLALKEAGGWSSVALVERYAHLVPAGREDAIRRFLGAEPELAARRA